MANKRMINGEIWEDEFFTSLSIFGRLLWIGIITTCADDQGRLRDNSALIRSNAFPLDDIKIADIENELIKFCNAGKIVRYTVDNKHLIQIVNWWKHQTPRWAGSSNYPAPEGWIDRERYHGINNVLVVNNWNSTGGYIVDYTDNYTKPKDDVKDDVNDEDEYSADPFTKTQQIIESIIGLPPSGKAGIDAINEIVSMGATEADIKAAASWIASQGKTIKYYSSLVGPTQTAIAKRTQKAKVDIGTNPYEGAKRYE